MKIDYNRAYAIVFILFAFEHRSFAQDLKTSSNFRNDMPSCRAHLFHEEVQGKSLRDYFIIVDRTVTLGDASKDTVDRAVRSIKAGDHVEVLSFSGLTESEFTKVEFDAYLDVSPTDDELETKIPASAVGKTKGCFQKQVSLARKKVSDILSSLLLSPIKEAKQSEILLALSSISTQSVTENAIGDKQMLVISDMVEHSDAASFYKDRGLRLIDPDKMLKSAQSAHLIGDFKGAKIYVAGAAAVFEGKKRSPGVRERTALKVFWEKWFQQSKATIDAWGEPVLLKDLP
jgi:hypothetical protein